MIMSPMGLRTKNDCSGEGHQQFTRPDPENNKTPVMNYYSERPNPPLVEEEVPFENTRGLGTKKMANASSNFPDPTRSDCQRWSHRTIVRELRGRPTIFNNRTAIKKALCIWKVVPQANSTHNYLGFLCLQTNSEFPVVCPQRFANPSNWRELTNEFKNIQASEHHSDPGQLPCSNVVFQHPVALSQVFFIWCHTVLLCNNFLLNLVPLSIHHYMFRPLYKAIFRSVFLKLVLVTLVR
jgi:hypothetical protein